jgi:hypothetical protein
MFLRGVRHCTAFLGHLPNQRRFRQTSPGKERPPRHRVRATGVYEAACCPSVMRYIRLFVWPACYQAPCTAPSFLWFISLADANSCPAGTAACCGPARLLSDHGCVSPSAISDHFCCTSTIPFWGRCRWCSRDARRRRRPDPLWPGRLPGAAHGGGHTRTLPLSGRAGDDDVSPLVRR